MILDNSALAAIFFGEPEAALFTLSSFMPPTAA
jgi:hypothetical protein